MIIQVGTTLIKTNHPDPDKMVIARQIENGMTAGRQDSKWWIVCKDQNAIFHESKLTNTDRGPEKESGPGTT